MGSLSTLLALQILLSASAVRLFIEGGVGCSVGHMWDARWCVPCSAFVEPLVILAILVANGTLPTQPCSSVKACSSVDETPAFSRQSVL